MARFRDGKEFEPTLDAAAEHLGISATAVEKDYWGSQTLRVLAGAFEGDFIFMGETAAAGIGGEALKFGGSETGRHRSYELTYPAMRKATPVIRSSVLLQMGVRGGPHPHDQVPINSLLGHALATAGTDLAEFADLQPFDVLVLLPGRTVLEKLVHIHELAQELAATARVLTTGDSADSEPLGNLCAFSMISSRM